MPEIFGHSIGNLAVFIIAITGTIFVWYLILTNKRWPMETTYCIIKPGTGVPGKTQIFTAVMEAYPKGFKLFSGVVLTEEQVLGLYGTLPPAIAEATARHMAGVPLSIIRIQGKNAIERIARMRGSDIDPEKCAPRSFRRMAAKLQTVVWHELPDGLRYCENFAHVPQNPKEAAYCHQLLETPS